MENLNVEKKLLLEKIYKLYCDNDINSFEEFDDEEFDVVLWRKFRDFRLSVSGGKEYSMGDIGMGCISGFIDNIVMWDNMMSDENGCYRGDLSYECRKSLFKLLDEEIKDKEFNNEVKKKYNEWYVEEYGEDYDEE
jgi:hypothetical protein